MSKKKGAAKCPKLNECHRIKGLGSKDLAGDWQYAEAIREICAKCEEKV